MKYRIMKPRLIGMIKFAAHNEDLYRIHSFENNEEDFENIEGSLLIENP